MKNTLCTMIFQNIYRKYSNVDKFISALKEVGASQSDCVKTLIF
jgi:hypothetical protein